MTPSQIAYGRLSNQRISEPKNTTPQELVQWMGAMQAQDYAMAKWAVGVRLPNNTHAEVENAMNEGKIIRTHVLRPTWHLVAATDVRWMLQLTAPFIRKSVSFMNRQLELDEKTFRKTAKLIVKALQGGRELTRPELMAVVNKSGVETNTLRAAHIMFDAELSGLVCNGARRGKHLTYALLDEKVPPTKTFTKEEALGELAKRYFASHGPATLPDFTWWSGLPITEAKRAMELIRSSLVSVTVGKSIVWFAAETNCKNATDLFLLPAFDEFMVSYKDRTASLPAEFAKTTITSNGIFKPIIVMNGRVVGLWKTEAQKSGLHLSYNLFDPAETLNQKKLAQAIRRFSQFANAKVFL